VERLRRRWTIKIISTGTCACRDKPLSTLTMASLTSFVRVCSQAAACNRSLISRNFGALAQKSWDVGSCSSETLKYGVHQARIQQQPVGEIDTLFARQISLVQIENINMIQSIFPNQRPAAQNYWILDEPSSSTDLPLEAANKNNRKAKRANKGKRPCSRHGRRSRKNDLGRRRR
jgi:uncharacterized protein YhdP